MFVNEGSISSSFPDSQNALHETGGCPANPSYDNCGSSVTFGSPLEAEKGVNKVKPAANLNPPVFEFMNKDATNTSSSDHDHKGNDVSKDGRSLAPEVDLVANSSKKDITDLTPIGANAVERGPFPAVSTNKESMVIRVVVHNKIIKALLFECYSLLFIFPLFSFPLNMQGGFLKDSVTVNIYLYFSW